jgi:hypothetical protein
MELQIICIIKGAYIGAVGALSPLTPAPAGVGRRRRRLPYSYCFIPLPIWGFKGQGAIGADFPL